MGPRRAVTEGENMENISLRLATQADVPIIMDIMTAAHDAMADPSAYITDDAAYVADHLSGKGFTLLAEVDGIPAAFFLVCAPGQDGGDLGRYLGFTPVQVQATAILDSVAVRPEYQGRGLMARLLAAALDRTADYTYHLATVAPDNWPSRKTFERQGFQVLKEIVKPQGQKRLLMGILPEAR
jgi:ribosomal protein S18 acetylase RimI-like enzyme